MVHERETCTPLRSYISKAVTIGAELNVYGNVVNEGTPTMCFVVYTINVECMYIVNYANYVT